MIHLNNDVIWYIDLIILFVTRNQQLDDLVAQLRLDVTKFKEAAE